MFRAECVRMQSATNLFADLIAEAQPFDTESPAKTARPLYRAECCSKSTAQIGNKPLAQKPQVPMACKLVGTVKGTKLWVGDCTDSAELRGAAAASETAPPSLPERARGAIPPGMKE